MKINKPTRSDRNRKAIVGVQKHYAALATVIIDGVSRTPASIRDHAALAARSRRGHRGDRGPEARRDARGQAHDGQAPEGAGQGDGHRPRAGPFRLDARRDLAARGARKPDRAARGDAGRVDPPRDVKRS